MAEKKDVLTPPFRVSYPKVFEPELNDLNGKMEYSLVAVFPKGADFAKLKAMCAEAIQEKWGAKKPKNLKNPFRPNEDRKDDESGLMPDGYEEGGCFITMKARQQPGIVGPKKDVKTGKPAAITEPEDFYAGCWAHAYVSAFAYENKGNCGVSFWVNSIQKLRDDEPISGRRRAEDVFSAIEGAEEEAAPTADPFAD